MLPADCAQGVLRLRGSSKESLGKPSPGLLGLQSSGSGSFLVCCKNMSGFAHLLYSPLPPPFSRVKERAGQRPGEQARSNLFRQMPEPRGWDRHLALCPRGSAVQLLFFYSSTQTPDLLSPWLILPAPPPPPGFLCGRAGSRPHGGEDAPCAGAGRTLRLRLPLLCLLVSCPSLSVHFTIYIPYLYSDSSVPLF